MLTNLPHFSSQLHHPPKRGSANRPRLRCHSGRRPGVPEHNRFQVACYGPDGLACRLPLPSGVVSEESLASHSRLRVGTGRPRCSSSPGRHPRCGTAVEWVEASVEGPGECPASQRSTLDVSDTQPERAQSKVPLMRSATTASSQGPESTWYSRRSLRWC